VRRLILALVLLVACRPAPVLNPDKEAGKKKPGRSEVERGLTVAPEAMVTTREGQPFDLASLWATQKVVVVFYRGGWCPHCQKQMAALQAHYKDFDAAHAIVVGISNEPGSEATALRTKLALGFELYSDPDLAVITKWGVADHGAGIARPATFVVEPGGAISYSKVGDNPADQPSMEEIIAALQ
jgi:peroxiredoxin